MSIADLQHDIDAWQAAYAEFFRALDGLPYNRREEPGICGVWNARQIVAHLAGWHQIGLARFKAIEGGDTARVHYDDDTVNAELVKVRAHLDWTQQVAELRMRMAALHEYATGMIARNAAYNEQYSDWFHGLSADAREHGDQIRAWHNRGD